MKNVLIAGLVHETHTFLHDRTKLSDFENLIWLHGDQVLDRCRGDVSPMGGALKIADQKNWKLTISQYGAAMPSGIVEDSVLDLWWSRVEKDLQNRSELDGVLLILHGAMAFESFPDGEFEIIRRISQFGNLPISICLDLHANFSTEMAQFRGVIFTAYRENPHTDAHETGMRSAQLLDLAMKTGDRTNVVVVKPRVLFSPKGTASANDPMRSLLKIARQLEADHREILEICVLPGFAYADVHCAGVSFCATTTSELDPNETRDLLEPLAQLALERSDLGNPLDPPIDEIMPLAMQISEGPIGIIEPSDNIGGGTPGDGTGVLQAFLKYEINNCVVVINDPDAVKICRSAEIGEDLILQIGGKVDNLHGRTLELPIKLLKLTDGKFDLENERSHLASLVGRRVEMGDCAVVRHKGIKFLLTSRKTPPMDLGQLRSQGIIPEELYMIAIKAAMSHKAVYDAILRASFYVDTEGLGSSDLRRFPYKNVPRPIKPLD